MPTVVDASCIGAMLFEEDVPPALAALLSSLHALDVIVPALWYWEVANSVVGATRRHRLTEAEVLDQLREMRRFRVSIDEESLSRAWESTLMLAFRHGLTAYDAAYLELALRRGLPLATLDGPLAEAARAEGVEVIGG